MNEHEIFFNVGHNSQLQIVLSEFITGKYKGKLSAETDNGGVPEKKAVLKIFAIFTGKYLCWSLFLIKLNAFRS